MIKKPLIIPFLITLIFSTFSPITIHSANAETVVNGSCTATVSSSAGVTVTVSGDYCVVSFTSTAAATTWTVPSGVTSIEYLVVAGGGQGGTDRGGGGGGGRVITGTISSPVGSYVMKVGAGGNTATGGWGTYVTADGDSSTVTSGGSQIIYAPGGGAGGSNGCAVTVARAGGSGGGGGMACNSGRAGGSVIAGTFPAGGTGYGYSGGSSLSSNDRYRATAGGGGAGGAGGAGSCGATPITTCPAGATGGSSLPNGGAGIANSITGTSTYYGAGGGGSVAVHSGECSGGYYSAGPGVGGSSIGGNGGSCTNMNGGVGTVNTGSGGGGSGCCSGTTTATFTGGANPGAAGGSGIVVVKYLKPITITITTITNKLFPRESTTASATVSSGLKTYSSSTTPVCTVNSSTGVITFVSTGSCTITAAASSSPSTTASTTFLIVPNITQKLISRTGIQPNALSSYIPPPYLSTSETYTVTSCVSIVGATGADLLSSTNLSFSLASLLVSPGVITDTGAGKSYTITGTLAQVQAAFSIFKLNSSSGRIMAANSGSIYLRARTNLVVDSATDTGCIDYNDARITLYQYTSDQVRRKNVPQKSGSTP